MWARAASGGNSTLWCSEGKNESEEGEFLRLRNKLRLRGVRVRGILRF